jgi:RNA polymerase sigma-70 factor, ECF subfamily
MPGSVLFTLGSIRLKGSERGRPAREQCVEAGASAREQESAHSMTLASEEDWVRRAQRGEPDALTWLVRAHGPRLQRMFLRVFGTRHDLEDLVQMTFLELLKALPGFRHESSFSTFLTGIGVRVGRRAMRPARVVRASVELTRADHVQHAASPPDEQARASELLRRVHLLLADVAEPKRVAFLLWSVEGLAPVEVAQAMQASLSATRSRIFYAQKELLASAQRDPYLREWLEERMP